MTEIVLLNCKQNNFKHFYRQLTNIEMLKMFLEKKLYEIKISYAEFT